MKIHGDVSCGPHHLEYRFRHCSQMQWMVRELGITGSGLCRMLPVSPADPPPVKFIVNRKDTLDGVNFAALSYVCPPRKTTDGGRRKEKHCDQQQRR